MTAEEGASEHPIEHIFHFVWLGSEPPPALLSTMDEVRSLSPGWEVRLWRDADLDWLRNRKWFDEASTYAGRANIARYEIIHRHGGVYVDADFEFLRPLGDSGVDLVGLVVVPERRGLYCNGLFGAPKGHPFLGRLIDALGPSIEVDPGAPSQIATGPHFFSDELLRWSAETGGTWSEFDRWQFFPYSFDRLDRAEGPWSPHVIAIHRWSQARDGRAYVRPMPAAPNRRAGLRPGRLVGSVRRKLRLRSRLAARAERRRRLREFAEWRPNAFDIGDGRAFTTDRHGRSIVFDSTDVNQLLHLGSLGEYDDRFHRFLERVLSGSDVYVDVGANIGQFVVTAARRLNRYGMVHAFEPVPRIAEILDLNVAMQRNAGASADVVVRRAAVGDVAGRVDLLVPVRHGGRSTTIPSAVADVDAASLEVLDVEMVTLDVTIGHLSHIRLLKIDVEGGESAVLRGAVQLVESGRVDFIDIESIRSHAARSISELGRLLDRWQDLGAEYADIEPDGSLRSHPGRASAVVARADHGHLVVDLRGLRRTLRT